MSSYGAAIDRARSKVSLRAPKILPDLCSFSAPTGAETRDADGYVTTADASIATDIPCSYSALSTFEREAGGGTGQTATHRLRLPANATTLSIAGIYRGVIAARGVTPALNFEVVGRLDNSTSIFLELAIVLKG